MGISFQTAVGQDMGHPEVRWRHSQWKCQPVNYQKSLLLFYHYLTTWHKIWIFVIFLLAYTGSLCLSHTPSYTPWKTLMHISAQQLGLMVFPLITLVEHGIWIHNLPNTGNDPYPIIIRIIFYAPQLYDYWSFSSMNFNFLINIPCMYSWYPMLRIKGDIN